MSIYRFVIIFIIFLSNYAICHGKSLEVEALSYTPMDITARANPRVDRNGQNCAIIKISLPIKGCTFDKNVVESIFDVNEYLVYVSPGTNSITLNCPEFDSLTLNLEDYIPNGISEKCVYRLSLSGYSANTNEEFEINGSYITLDIYPKNISAPSVKIDGVPQTVNNSNQILVFLPYGNHTYAIDAIGYYTNTAEFFTSEKGESVLKIQMRSNKASAHFEAVTPGTQIFINGQSKGYDNWEESLSPGTYLIEGRKESHRPYRTTISVSNPTDTLITIPVLTPILSNIHVAVSPADAHILLDGEEIGVTPMNVRDILIGPHKVTISKPGYVSYNENINLQEGIPYTLEYALDKIVDASSTNSNSMIQSKYEVSDKNQDFMDFAKGRVNGHEYVDLGLPSGTKWATCNIGAEFPSMYGEYFAWGETKTKKKYTDKNSKTYKKQTPQSIARDPKYDASTFLWGKQWQIPSVQQYQELIDNCKWDVITVLGVPGCMITGPNENSIFLPLAGVHYPRPNDIRDRIDSGPKRLEIDDFTPFRQLWGPLSDGNIFYGHITLSAPSSTSERKSNIGIFILMYENKRFRLIEKPKIIEESRYHGFPIRPILAN